MSKKNKMSKRERPKDKFTILILRGVPGTGKSTLARSISEYFINIQKFECASERNTHCKIINRDLIRLKYITSAECKEVLNGKRVNYQDSFKNATINSLIRDKYFNEIAEAFRTMRFNDGESLLIIDSTNTKIADLIRLLKIIEPYDFLINNVDYNIYILTKRHEHGNIHNVPEKVMNAFREELKESDEWLNKKFPKKENVTLL